MTSSIFELVKTVELDIQLRDHSWTTRIELFRDTEKEGYFRCHVWETELFRLTPSFPQDEKNEPAHICDDILMAYRGIAHSEIASRMHEPFRAADAEAAMGMVIEDLKRFLEHVTREKAG